MKLKIFIVLTLFAGVIHELPIQANDIDTVWMRWTHNVFHLYFTPDNQNIISTAIGGNIIVHNTESGNEVKNFSGAEILGFAPNHNLLFGGVSSRLKVWDLSNYNNNDIFFEYDSIGVGDISVSANEDKIAGVRSKDNQFNIWDINTGHIIFEKNYEPIGSGQDAIITRIPGLQYTKDGKYLAVEIRKLQADLKGDYQLIETYLDLFNPESNEKIKQLSIINGFEISNTGKYLITKGEYNQGNIPCEQQYGLRVSDIETQEELLTINWCPTDIRDIAFSPDDKYLAVAYYNGKKIEIWSLSEKNLKYQYFTSPIDPYTAVTASIDNRLIAAGSGPRIYLYKSYWSMLSVPENAIQATITYPNPTMALFNLEFDLISNNQTIIDIVDLSGNVVKIIDSKFLSSGHYLYQIDISDLPAGIYTLRVLSGTYSFSSKIVKL